MKLFKKKETKYNSEIDRILEKMKGLDVESNEYKKCLERLEVLAGLEVEGKKEGIDKNTILKGAFSVASILIVLYYEKVNVITSKAFGLIGKGR